MKLITFDSDNMSSFKNGKPYLRINRCGHIGLSNEAIFEMKLFPDDRISFHQDKENPNDWYLTIKDKNGFKLRERSKHKGLVAFSKNMANEILDCFSMEGNSYSMIINTRPIPIENGMLLYPIITSSIK